MKKPELVRRLKEQGLECKEMKQDELVVRLRGAKKADKGKVATTEQGWLEVEHTRTNRLEEEQVETQTA